MVEYIRVTKKIISMIEELGKVGIKIMLVLYKGKGRKYIAEILKEGDISPSSIYRGLSVLADFGLIYYEDEYGRKFVNLTDPGWIVAEHLCKADQAVIKAKKTRLSQLKGSG